MRRAIPAILLLALPLGAFAVNRVGDANNDHAQDMADASLVQSRLYGSVAASAISPLALAGDDGTLDVGDLLIVAQIATGARTGVAPQPALLTVNPPAKAFYVSGTVPNPVFGFGIASNYPAATMVNGLDALAWDIVEGGAVESTLANSAFSVTSATASTELVALNPGPPDDTVSVRLQIPLEDSSGGAAQTASGQRAMVVYGPFCGDGVLDPGEICDDGNKLDNDGCSHGCLTETSTCTPAVVGTLGEGTVVEVKGDNGLLYVLRSHNSIPVSNFEIYNIDDASDPQLLGYYRVFSSDIWYTFKTFDVEGNFAYLFANNRIITLDISNPVVPAMMGSVSFPDTGGIGYGSYRTFKVNGGHGYLLLNGLCVTDLTNPAAPTAPVPIIPTWEYQGVSVDGPVGALMKWDGTIDILDISNPLLPTVVSNVVPSGGWQDILATNGILYVTNSASQIEIYDISIPSTPVLALADAGDGDYLCQEGNDLYSWFWGTLVTKYSQWPAFGPLDYSYTPSYYPYYERFAAVQGGTAAFVRLGGAYLRDFADPDNFNSLIPNLELPSALGYHNGRAYVPSRIYYFDFSNLGVIDLADLYRPQWIDGLERNYGDYYDSFAIRQDLGITNHYPGSSWPSLETFNLGSPPITGCYSYPFSGVRANGTAEIGSNLAYGDVNQIKISPLNNACYNGFTPVIGLWENPADSWWFTALAASSTHIYGLRVLGGLDILDATNPAAPFQVAHFDNFSTAKQVVVSGNLLITSNGEIFDISAPALPTQISNVGGGTNMVVRGDFLYLDGAGAYNISQPGSPVPAGGMAAVCAVGDISEHHGLSFCNGYEFSVIEGLPGLCSTTCGNGLIESPEEDCDDGAANGTPGSCCSSSCMFKRTGEVCRPSLDIGSVPPGTCDPAEVCDGSSSICPADQWTADGLACDDGATPTCDFCQSGLCTSGASACGNGFVDCLEDCDERANNGTPGSCCTLTCGFKPAGTVCRPTIDTVSIPPGTCDPEEVCDGVSATCSPDMVAPDGTYCDDGIAPTCNNACSSGICANWDSVCGDGTVDSCWEACDLGVFNGLPGFCCSASCQFVSAGTICRAGVDACDAAETCTGASDACPSNQFAPAGTICRAGSGDSCDPAETCTGASATCPADVVNPAGTTCRADSDASGCDTAEYCNGVAGAACPVDTCEPVGQSCSPPAGGLCDAMCSCLAGTNVTSVLARKGTSPGHFDVNYGDYNYGMTQGEGAASDLYVILPNDPLVTGGAQPSAGGVDLVVADVTLDGPLGAGDTVNCSWQSTGGPFDTTDCNTGDSACVVFAPHPQLTGGGLSLNNQQAISPGTGGIGTAVAPDEVDTAHADTINCRVNAGTIVSQNVTVRLGFIGVRDKAVPAGTGSVSVDFFVYCANGNTQECGGFDGSVDRGVSYVSAYFFYDPAVFSSIGPATTPADRSGVSNAYNQVAAGTPFVPGPGSCSPSGTVYCYPAAPGVTYIVGKVIPCNGQAMLYVGSCMLNYAGTLPGQTTWIDPITISNDFLNFPMDRVGYPIRAIDSMTFNPTPSSNVRGTILFK